MKRNLKYNERCHPRNNYSSITQALILTELEAAQKTETAQRSTITKQMIINFGSKAKAVLLRHINIT